MTTLPLSPDALLTTTRAVRRRLDLDRPVDPALVRECVEVAIQAPTASNRQDWHFVFVTDPERRNAVADFYRRSFDIYRSSAGYAGRVELSEPDRAETQQRVASSADYLAAHLDEVPVLLIPCIARRADSPAPIAQASLWASIVPATWSFMLAARARGLGTAWTTLHLRYEEEAADLLGIPFPEVTQAALIPIAHYTGEGFRPAPRADADSATHWDGW